MVKPRLRLFMGCMLPAPGRARNVARYHSIQHHFPASYGLGIGGLPETASLARKVMARQLKAYLLFYDQILANQFAQLAQVASLLSMDDESVDSYFSQPVADDGLLGLDEVLHTHGVDYGNELKLATESPLGEDMGARRRERFLDHLLARFGERFQSNELLQTEIKDTGDGPQESRLASDKRAFLREIPRIGYDRGTAFNYLEPESENNISGLERLLRRKFGTSQPEERFYLIEHVLLRPISGDAMQRAPLIRTLRDADPYSLKLTFVFPIAGRYARPQFRQLVEHAIREYVPVHLTHYVLWKESHAMREFVDAYQIWLKQLREHARSRFGL